MAQFGAGQARGFLMLGADQVVDLGRGLDPRAEILPARQISFDLVIVEERAILQVDDDHLARVQPSLLDHIGVVDAHHAGFRAGDQQVVAGDGVAHRPQAVTVHAAEDPTAPIGGQRRRSVPGLHHGVAIGVEVAQILGHVAALVPRFRQQHAFDHRQLPASPHQ